MTIASQVEDQRVSPRTGRRPTWLTALSCNGTTALHASGSDSGLSKVSDSIAVHRFLCGASLESLRERDCVEAKPIFSVGIWFMLTVAPVRGNTYFKQHQWE